MAQQRVEFIKKIDIKRRLFNINHIPSKIAELEIESVYLYNEMLSPQSLKRNLLSAISNDEIDLLAIVMTNQVVLDRLKIKEEKYSGICLHKKWVSQDKRKNLSSTTIEDFF